MCKRRRGTTNNQSPYVCEICLRDEGRKLLLDTTFKPNSLAIRGFIITGIVVIIAYLLGKFGP